MCEVASMVHKLFDKKSAFHKGEEIYKTTKTIYWRIQKTYKVSTMIVIK